MFLFLNVLSLNDDINDEKNQKKKKEAKEKHTH